MPGKLTTFALCAFFLVPADHCWPQSQASQGNIIHVEVVGMRNDKGQISCSLYSSAEDFPKKAEKAVAHSVAPISEREAVCEFTGTAPGTYAVSVLHDENSNGKLDGPSISVGSQIRNFVLRKIRYIGKFSFTPYLPIWENVTHASD